jgi:hypothetical protein
MGKRRPKTRNRKNETTRKRLPGKQPCGKNSIKGKGK